MQELFFVNKVDSVTSQGPVSQKTRNLTGPRSYFEIKVSRNVECVLTSIDVHFVSLADCFTVQFSNLLRLHLKQKTKQLTGSGNKRELRETGPSWFVKSDWSV